MSDENLTDLSQLMNGIRLRLNLDDIELERQSQHREVLWNVLYSRYLNGKDSKCFPNNEEQAEMSPDDNVVENVSSESEHENDVDSSISDFESADELDDDQSDLITQLLNKTYTMAKNRVYNDDCESITLSSFYSDSNPLIDKVTLQEASLTLQELTGNNHKDKMTSLLNCTKEKAKVLSETVDSDDIRCSRFSDKMLEDTSISLNTVLAGKTIVDKNELVYNWIQTQTFAVNSRECKIVYKNENFDLNSSSESETRMLHESYYKETPKKSKSSRIRKPRGNLRNDKINMKGQINKRPIVLKRRDVENSSSSVDTTAYIISSRKNKKKSFNTRFSTYKSNNNRSLKVAGKDKELPEAENHLKSIEKKLQTKLHIDSVSLNVAEEILKADGQRKGVIEIDTTSLNKNKQDLIHNNTLGNTKTDCGFTRYTAEKSFLNEIFKLDSSPTDVACSNIVGIKSNNTKKALFTSNSPNTTKNSHKIVSDIFVDDSDSDDDTNKITNSEGLDNDDTVLATVKGKANSPEVNIHGTMNSAKTPLNRQPKKRSKTLIKPQTFENVNDKFTNNKSNRKSTEKNLQIKNAETLKNLSKEDTTLEERENKSGFTTKSFIEDIFHPDTIFASHTTNIDSSLFNFKNRSKYNKTISDIFADDTDSAESYNGKMLDEAENTVTNITTNVIKMHSIFSDSDTDDCSELNKLNKKTFPGKNLTNFTKNGMKLNTSDTSKPSEHNILNNKNILDQNSNEETEPSGSYTFLQRITRSKHNLKEKFPTNKKDINKNSIENSNITNISIFTPTAQLHSTKRLRKSSNRPLKRKCTLIS